MIASVERAAQHRNGKGTLPYISMFATAVAGQKLHALIFAEPGRIAMFDLDDPTQRLCAGTYEHALRAAVAEIGLPIDGGDPLEFLHGRAVQILDLVRQIPRHRSAPRHGRTRARARYRKGKAMSACNGCGNAFGCMFPDCAAGASHARAYESDPDGRESSWVRDVFEKPARHAAAAREGADVFDRSLRPPIVPGLNLDPGEPPQPSRWRTVARWAGAIALVGGAVSIMYAEGQRQPAPGVGFGIALALLMGAALLLGRSNDG